MILGDASSQCLTAPWFNSTVIVLQWGDLFQFLNYKSNQIDASSSDFGFVRMPREVKTRQMRTHTHTRSKNKKCCCRHMERRPQTTTRPVHPCTMHGSLNHFRKDIALLASWRENTFPRQVPLSIHSVSSGHNFDCLFHIENCTTYVEILWEFYSYTVVYTAITVCMCICLYYNDSISRFCCHC